MIVLIKLINFIRSSSMVSSDNYKRIILCLSVFLAIIIFISLYFIKMKTDNVLEVNQSDRIIKDTRLKENKSIYEKDNPGELIKVYINVFPTIDGEGNYYNLSSFDLVADWNTDFNPVLDANIQFISGGKQLEIYKTITPNAFIRVRGDKGASLKSYRIKLIDGEYNGQSVFNIDKNLKDPSRIANKLAHDLIKDLDHISGFRTNFLQLFIKDASLSSDEFFSCGLYTHIEQPNKAYLRNHGLDENGNLYMAENFDFKLTSELKNSDAPDYDKQAFESVLSIREGKDHTGLINMLKDINDTEKNFNDVFNFYFNEDNYLTWFSINILLYNTYATNRNFLLYNPSSSPVWYFLPWDFKGIFLSEDNSSDNQYIMDKFLNVDLHRRYFEQEGNLKKLHNKIEKLISDQFSPKRIKTLKKSYMPILLELMDKYPDNVLLSEPINTYISFIDKIDEYIFLNYQIFRDWYEEHK